MAVPARKGRGAISAPDGRFTQQSTVPDAEEAAAQQEKPLETQLIPMHAGRIISNNTSPDVPFDHSINPYLGCEHGCVYCYARPSHSYLDLSPGLDFETRIYYKPNAVERLLDAWQKPGYRCEPITIGANTDPYQPGEKQLELTRRLLQAFRDYRHPVNIISKSHLIERDLDILSDLAADRLASVAISIPTMDDALKRIMEPRVPAAPKRLAAISRLADAGVPVSTLIAPVIPAINDHEIEALLNAAAKAGAQSARYIYVEITARTGGAVYGLAEDAFSGARKTRPEPAQTGAWRPHLRFAIRYPSERPRPLRGDDWRSLQARRPARRPGGSQLSAIA